MAQLCEGKASELGPLSIQYQARTTHLWSYDSGVDTWSDEVCHGVEKWLAHVASGAMAYFLWEDGGATQLLSEFEPDLVDAYLPLPKNVQRTDTFRILVSKSISRVVRSTFLVFSWEDVVKFLSIF